MVEFNKGRNNQVGKEPQHRINEMIHATQVREVGDEIESAD